jgi:hypothetical protein
MVIQITKSAMLNYEWGLIIHSNMAIQNVTLIILMHVIQQDTWKQMLVAKTTVRGSEVEKWMVVQKRGGGVKMKNNVTTKTGVSK